MEPSDLHPSEKNTRSTRLADGPDMIRGTTSSGGGGGNGFFATSKSLKKPYPSDCSTSIAVGAPPRTEPCDVVALCSALDTDTPSS